MSITLTNGSQVNSTSYIDLLGVLQGLSRMPGETSESFFDRICKAAQSDRSNRYEGLVNNLSIEFGTSIYQAIDVEGATEADVTVTVAGVVISDPVGVKATLTSPLMVTGPDGNWTWRMMSDIVSDINGSGTWTAGLNYDDAPAVQLAKQDNTLISLAQVLPGGQQHYSLGKTGILLGSESFSNTVPTYTLDREGNLQFSQMIPSDVNITYQYRVWPYSLVASEVAVLGMMEPAIAKVALTSDGVLTNQMIGYIQDIMNQDRSYWGV